MASRRVVFVRAAALAAAFCMLLPVAATAQERTIVVRGQATQEVPNDTASLVFTVAKERRSRAAALRIVAIRLSAVIATVQSFPGVGPGDVTTGPISIREVSARGKRPLFRVREGVVVILHQPERAGEMVAAAIASGATSSRGPSFFPGNPEVAYNDTLLAAFDQAKAKATALATRAGAVLGPAIGIEEGSEVEPSQPRQRGVEPTSSEPAPPVKPGGSTVTATVRVVFALL
jgi:uncharacterized protein YggE